MAQHVFRATVWQYPGMAGWHFVSLPKTLSAKLKKLYGNRARGWGSLPVTMTVGKTTWKTSIFPDRKAGTYLLPLKAKVRKQTDIGMGDKPRFELEVMYATKTSD